MNFEDFKNKSEILLNGPQGIEGQYNRWDTSPILPFVRIFIMVDLTALAMIDAVKEIYYKFCLRRHAPDVPLTKEEKTPDEYNVRA